MHRPKSSNEYSGRNLDCQDAMEAKFTALCEDAIRSGWRDTDITRALAELMNDWVLYRRTKQIEGTASSVTVGSKH